ncbi:MAG: DedA family protein [Bacteroidetes bacterium]|nr:DedA family protein [Bacteroidota bacterium]
MEHVETQQDNIDQPLQWWALTIKTLLLAAVIIVVYGVLGLLFHDQLSKAGVWLGRELGYSGVALYTFVVDAVIIPTTVDVIFPFAIEWNPYILITVMSAVSVLGGYLGYWIARSFNHFRSVQRVTSSYRERGETLINRYGAWAVAISGFTPIPFSTICWIAGLLKIPAGKVFLACFARIPRMIVYYLLIKSGFSLIERFSG